jgi:uncharacterized membrane protein/DNA-directed RNA polymerase subunit RPC12/RpoP
MNYNKILSCLSVLLLLTLGSLSYIPFLARAEGIALTVSDGIDERMVSAGSVAVYNLKVENTDTAGQREVNLTLVGIPTGWVADIHPNPDLILGNQTQATRTLIVTVPANATAETIGVITVIADNRLVGGGGEGSVSLATTTRIKQTYGLNVSTSDPDKEIAGGSSAGFDLVIKNEGNGVDTVVISVHSAPKGWAIIPPNSVSIPPSGSAKVTIACNVPANTTAGLYYFVARATSENVTFLSEQAYIVNVAIQRGVSLRILNGTGFAEAWPGSYTTFTLEVSNKGNVADVFDLVVLGLNSSWAELGATTVQIGQGGIMNVLLRISLPKGTAQGNYSFTVRVESIYTAHVQEFLTFTIFAFPVGNLGVYSNQYSKSGLPGENVTYSLFVINKGNCDDIVHPKMTRADSDIAPYITFDGKDLPLFPGETRELDVHFQIPSELEALDASHYTFTISFFSKLNRSVPTGTSFGITVENVYNLSLFAAEPSQILEIDGDYVVWDIDIKNNGNGDDTSTPYIYQKDAKWQKSWWSFEPTSLDIPHGMVRTTTLKLWVSSSVDVGPGNYSFKVATQSDDGQTISAPLTLYVKVVKSKIQIISWEIKKAKPRVDERVLVEVTIKNIGDAATPTGIDLALLDLNYNYRVSFYTTSKLSVGENKTVTLTWVPTRTGSYFLKVRVTVAGENYETTTKSVTVQDTGNSFDPIFLWSFVLVLGIVVLVIVGGLASGLMARRYLKAPISIDSELKDDKQIGKDGQVDVVCPRCKAGIKVTTTKRPLELRCPSCGAKLLLRA